MKLPGLDELEVEIAHANEAVDPTAILLAEHVWLRALLSGYHESVSKGERLAEIHSSIEALKPLLELHIKREEEVYFPAVEAFVLESGRGSTIDMYGEHDAIRIRIDELLMALGGASHAPAAFAAFSRSLLNHFDNEEELIFTDTPQRLSLVSRNQILAKFRALTD